MSRNSTPLNRSWVRSHFTDHPRFASKDPDIYAGTGSTKDKIKVFCTLCLERRISTIEATNINLTSSQPRTRDAIIEGLFAVDQHNPGREWLSSRPDVLLNHLRNCSLQPQQVVNQAEEDHRMRQRIPAAQLRSPQRNRVMASATAPSAIPGYAPFVSTPPFSANVDPLLHQPNPCAPFASSSLATLGLGLPQAIDAPSRSPSVVSSLSPSDSISRAGSRAPSGSRRSRRTPSQAFIADPDPIWTPGRQFLFEQCLIRVSASAGLPLSWVDNPEFLAFCLEFIPGAKVPSRGVLTNRILPRAVNGIRIEIRKAVAGQHATAQADGWSGINNHHYIAFMATVNGKVYTIRVHDASDERKTAEHLYCLMLEVLGTLINEWKVVVVGFTTDASGESRKARSLLTESHPHLICPDCYAHQVNLIVGDYFKVDTEFSVYSKMATELITWLRSKTYVLALLREAQSRASRVLTVIRAVLTRWTAHYLAFRRLLELRPALQSMVSADEMLNDAERRLVTGDRSSKAKSREMIQIITNNNFWYALARIKTHLEPLARAANITQGATCRLDQTLLTLASLFIHYTYIMSPDHSADADVDTTACLAILTSLEKRWKKADQDVFIAAIILNPFIKFTPFRNTVSFLSPAGVLSLLCRLYVRLFRVNEAPTELHQNLEDYIKGRGIYADLENYSKTIEESARKAKQSPNPLDVYNGLCSLVPGAQDPPLTQLARHLLSVCTNSASCERLFSVFGNTLTKLRNRLGTKTLVSLTELKMHIRDEHLRNAEAKARIKRRFGKEVMHDTIPTTTASSLPASGVPNATVSRGPSPPPLPHTSHSSESESAVTHPDADTIDLMSIANTFMAMLDDDEDTEPAPFPSRISISLMDLFDYRSTHWIAAHERSASRSFDEELEFYELTSLDADGEADIDIDATVDSILNV